MNSADEELLFGGRNDERNRCHSLDSRPLVLTDHREWMEGALAFPDVDLILACNNMHPGSMRPLRLLRDAYRPGLGLPPKCINRLIGLNPRSNQAWHAAVIGVAWDVQYIRRSKKFWRKLGVLTP